MFAYRNGFVLFGCVLLVGKRGFFQIAVRSKAVNQKAGGSPVHSEQVAMTNEGRAEALEQYVTRKLDGERAHARAIVLAILMMASTLWLMAVALAVGISARNPNILQ